MVVCLIQNIEATPAPATIAANIENIGKEPQHLDHHYCPAVEETSQQGSPLKVYQGSCWQEIKFTEQNPW